MPYANREDQIAAQKRWYEANKGKHREWNKVARRKLVDWFTEYKKTLACVLCGEKEPACLDFHHLRDKDREVAVMVKNGAGKQAILDEISKCIIVCANCHRKIHAGIVDLPRGKDARLVF